MTTRVGRSARQARASCRSWRFTMASPIGSGSTRPQVTVARATRTRSRATTSASLRKHGSGRLMTMPQPQLGLLPRPRGGLSLLQRRPHSLGDLVPLFVHCELYTALEAERSCDQHADTAVKGIRCDPRLAAVPRVSPAGFDSTLDPLAPDGECLWCRRRARAR